LVILTVPPAEEEFAIPYVLLLADTPLRPRMELPVMVSEVLATPLTLLMPMKPPLVPALYVIALVEEDPTWLLLMEMVPVTAPIFCIAVKLPVVAVDVFPLMMLLVILNAEAALVLLIAMMLELAAPPVTAVFNILFPLMATLMPDTTVEAMPEIWPELTQVIPSTILLDIVNAALAAPLVFKTPIIVPVVATLKVIGEIPPLPRILFDILMAVTTAPEFVIPVKPPVVAVEVIPFTRLLVMFRMPGAEECVMPMKELEVPTPFMTLLIIELLLILVVAVDKAVRPWLKIPSIPPDKSELESVIVLLLIVEVIVPVGCPTE